MEELEDLYYESLKACTIAGQSKEVTPKHRKQQLSYIQSELAELQDALDVEDLVEELDACMDILVTVFGYLDKLKSLGAHVGKAMYKTAENNLSKFPASFDEVEQTMKFYKEVKNKETTWSYNPNFKRYVVRDTNGKYLKPSSFVENDLSDCFEKEI